MMKQMFKAMPNSPITRITTTVTADATTIPVLEGTKLPQGPNIATLGVGADSETIIYESNSNGTLTGVTRGVEGNKREWPKGTEIARYFTAYDHNAFVENIMGLIDAGENENGHWIKFANGYMACYATIPVVYQSANYLSLEGNKYWMYPQEFIGKPTLLVSKSADWTSGKFTRATAAGTPASNIAAMIRLYAASNGEFVSGDVYTLYATAIGRWK